MHLEIALLASPEKHKRFVKELNNWEYYYEGTRKGTYRPFISELKFYDVRIKKEVAAEFVRDLQTHSIEGIINLTLKNKLYVILIKLISKLLKLTTIKPAEGPPKYRFNKWYYAYLIGGIKDPEQKEAISGRNKEVL